MNFGTFWTEDESNRLAELHQSGATIPELMAALNRPESAVRSKLRRIVGQSSPASVEPVPKASRSLVDLLEDSLKSFDRKRSHHEAKRQGVNVDIEGSGPFALVAFGDPHVDDNGFDLDSFTRSVRLVRSAKDAYAFNVGDLTNNWIGRLARLYAHQNTTDDEAVTLCRWLLEALPWLFVILGNHDKWSPVAELLCAEVGVLHVSHGAIFKVNRNGETWTLDARHDHPGRSMYNPAHGQVKRSYRGSQADILIGGHLHVSGYTIAKNEVTGQIGHCARVGAFKRYDDYADANGYGDGHISPVVCFVCVPDASPEGRVVAFHDLEQGLFFLKALQNG